MEIKIGDPIRFGTNVEADARLNFEMKQENRENERNQK